MQLKKLFVEKLENNNELGLSQHGQLIKLNLQVIGFTRTFKFNFELTLLIIEVCTLVAQPKYTNRPGNELGSDGNKKACYSMLATNSTI
jgi:hypothetical protein